MVLGGRLLAGRYQLDEPIGTGWFGEVWRATDTALSRPVAARRPKTRYAAGFGARPMIFLHDVLPDRTFDVFIRRAAGVPS